MKIFGNLKKEQINRHIYATRQDAKSDVFDYIEGFYNRVRRHSHLDQLSPLAFQQIRTEVEICLRMRVKSTVHNVKRYLHQVVPNPVEILQIVPT